MHGSLKFLASHFHLLLFINPSRPSFFPSFAACYLDTVTCSAGSHAFYGQPTTLPWAKKPGYDSEVRADYPMASCSFRIEAG